MLHVTCYHCYVKHVYSLTESCDKMQLVLLYVMACVNQVGHLQRSELYFT
jgi:hypothetical protein